MADDTIFQRIAFEGGDEVVSSLKEIGKAGEEVFASFEDGLTGVLTALAAFGAAILAAGAAVGVFAKVNADAVKEMGDLAHQAGTTVEDISGLKGALVALGAQPDNLGAQFRKMAVTIEQAWEEVKKSADGAKNQQIDDNLAVIKSNEAVANSATTIERASLSLAQAKSKLAASQGVAVDPQIELLRQHKALVLDVQEAEQKLQAAEQAQVEAIQKAAEAAKKADDDRRNSIETVSDAVKRLINGTETLKQASTQANLTVDNIVKGLVINAGPASEQLKLFSGNIHDLSNQAPSVREVFKQVADFFKQSGDSALNTAVAYKLFGRSVSQDLIDGLGRGSKALDDEARRLENLGLVVTKPQEEIGKELVEAFEKLSNAVKVTGNQIGLLFAPAFTTGFEKLNELIEHNHQRIIDFATSIASQAEPIIKAFFKLLSGEELGDTDPAWIKTIVNGLSVLAHFITDTITPIILDFFRLINGETVKTQWLANIVEAFGILKDVTGAVAGFFASVLETIYVAINRAFGRDISRLVTGFGQLISDVLGLIRRLAQPVIDVFNFMTAAIDKLRAQLGKGEQASIVDPKPIKDSEQALHGVTDAVHGVTEGAHTAGTATEEAGHKTTAAAKEMQGGLKAVGQTVADFKALMIELGGDGASTFAVMSKGAKDTNPAIVQLKTSAADLKAALAAAAASPTGQVKLGGSLFIDAEQQIKAVQDGLLKVKGLVQNPFFEPVAEDAKKSFDQATEDAGKAAADIGLKLQPLAEDIDKAFNGEKEQSAFDKLEATAEDTFNKIKDEWKVAPIIPNTPPDETWGKWLDNIEQKAKDVFDKIKAFANAAISTSAASQGGGAGSENPGFAGGGLVFGPGGDRSDSILARLSRGEFVIQAPAVRWVHSQVPGLLHALNNFQLPSVPRFAFGGPVGFARATPAAAGRPVVLNIHDRTFNVTATNDVAESLSRFATERQMRRTSNKASDWKR